MTGKNCMVSPVTYRRGRLIDTYSWRLLVLHVSNDDQEREQSSADNPNVNAHVGTSECVPKRRLRVRTAKMPANCGLIIRD